MKYTNFEKYNLCLFKEYPEYIISLHLFEIQWPVYLNSLCVFVCGVEVGGTFPAITGFLMQAYNDAIQVQSKKIKVVTVSGILLDHWMIMTEGFPVDLCPWRKTWRQSTIAMTVHSVPGEMWSCSVRVRSG